MKLDRVLMTSGVLKVSKPGFDVKNATVAQLLLGAGVYPQAIIEAGKVLTGVQITFDFNLPYIPAITFQSSAAANLVMTVPYSNYGSADTFVTGVPTTTGLSFSSSQGTRLVNYLVLRRAAS